MILPYIWRYLVHFVRLYRSATFFGSVYVGMTTGFPIAIVIALFPFCLIPLPFICVSDGLVYLYRRRRARIKAKWDKINAEFGVMVDRWSEEALARIKVQRELEESQNYVFYLETALENAKRPKIAALKDVVDDVSRDHLETVEVLQNLPIHPADRQSLIYVEEDLLLDRIRNVLRHRDKR
ncbi:MAG: hypothetical protein JWP89_2657 [Schlesneria sp.]|nr:hypothetical protein [Schlesneria sp.]